MSQYPEDNAGKSVLDAIFFLLDHLHKTSPSPIVAGQAVAHKAGIRSAFHKLLPGPVPEVIEVTPAVADPAATAPDVLAKVAQEAEAALETPAATPTNVLEKVAQGVAGVALDVLEHAH